MRTLILSDIHLGNRHCNTPLIQEVLDKEPFDRLILNGDTINNVNLRKLSGAHWNLLNRFRKIGKEREVILIRGNHDHEVDYDPLQYNAAADGHGGCAVGSNGTSERCDGPSNGELVDKSLTTFNVLPSLLELPMLENYRMRVNGRSYLVLHGDLFDPTLRYPVMTEVACFCYQLTTKINKKLAKWLKKKSKRWSGVLEFVRQQSVKHAQQNGVEGVITGHTHFAEDSFLDDIHFINTGCWTEYPCSYVIADDQGLTLHHQSE